MKRPGGGGGNYIYLYNFPLPACAHLILAVFQTVHSFNDIVATILDIDYQLLFLKLDLFSYLLQFFRGSQKKNNYSKSTAYFNALNNTSFELSFLATILNLAPYGSWSRLLTQFKGTFNCPRSAQMKISINEFV